MSSEIDYDLQNVRNVIAFDINTLVFVQTIFYGLKSKIVFTTIVIATLSDFSFLESCIHVYILMSIYASSNSKLPPFNPNHQNKQHCLTWQRPNLLDTNQSLLNIVMVQHKWCCTIWELELQQKQNMDLNF